ncbi:chemotaxis response regulator CheB [Bradyrhizobium sp. i1.4.4]
MSEKDHFPIVGIGASAGGIEALEGFFRGLPREAGAALVIVTHLSPDRESLLHEIVARYTDLPVRIASDGEKVGPDRVYIMPSNHIRNHAEAPSRVAQKHEQARTKADRHIL